MACRGSGKKAQRDRQAETERQRQSERDTETEAHRERQRQRETATETEKQKERGNTMESSAFLQPRFGLRARVFGDDNLGVHNVATYTFHNLHRLIIYLTVLAYIHFPQSSSTHHISHSTCLHTLSTVFIDGSYISQYLPTYIQVPQSTSTDHIYHSTCLQTYKLHSLH